MEEEEGGQERRRFRGAEERGGRGGRCTYDLKRDDEYIGEREGEGEKVPQDPLQAKQLI